MFKPMNAAKRFGAKVVTGTTLVLFTGAAMADGFTAPDIDFASITAWVGGALLLGVVGVALAMKGIELAKRGINKV